MIRKTAHGYYHNYPELSKSFVTWDEVLVLKDPKGNIVIDLIF